MFSELFEERRCRLLKQLILGEGGLRLHTKKIARYFKVGFIGNFHSRLKFKVVFHLANFFNLTKYFSLSNFVPINLVLRASLYFLAWKVKEGLRRC